ncbi:hypothetical protein V496_00433 [Pseudogymnoascus sp. VKM F-4515 (FW-2607)]|nr:hypothetical protein V496_00433 [Pseudogymnoascus sp. VKM F-4515 (FW-2607)]
MSSPAPPATATATATTPPDRSKGTPLTPPPTEEKSRRTPIVQILDEVRRRWLQQGQSSFPPWQRFPLQEDEYTNLLAEVGKESFSVREFWTHRLRYDYLPSISTLILRMPTATHERFITKLVHEITRQLETLASADRPSSDFARQIDACGSTTIRFPDDYGRHDPDGSFAHTQAQFPGVVFEVSYSQKRRDLGRLADDYILGSDGNVRAVVGLDIEYQGNGRSRGKSILSKVATLSVWRPKITVDDDGEELSAHQEVVDVEFRDKDGVSNSSPDAGISLRIDDFAPTALHPFSPMSEEILIPATTLAEFLADAENAELMIKENAGVRQVPGKVLRKRRRASTPAEDLDEGGWGLEAVMAGVKSEFAFRMEWTLGEAEVWHGMRSSRTTSSEKGAPYKSPAIAEDFIVETPITVFKARLNLVSNTAIHPAIHATVARTSVPLLNPVDPHTPKGRSSQIHHEHAGAIITLNPTTITTSPRPHWILATSTPP